MKKLMRAMLLVFGIAVFMCTDINVKAQECEAEAEEAAVMAASADAVVYYESEEDVVKALRKGMKERQKTITVGLTIKKELKQADLKEYFNQAVKHTGVPTEGDYLLGHYSEYKCSVSYTYTKAKVYTYTFTYNFTYNSDAKQEAATDAKVAEILAKLNLKGKDDYTKVKAIYDYICKNVTYDWKNLNDNSNKVKYTAYAAAVNGTSVCQGYSLLFYRLCLESGVDARVIEGTGNGGAHSWNIVKVNGTYYYVDATWDSDNSSYKWFLKGTGSFSEHKASSLKGYSVSKADYSNNVHTHSYKSTITEATFSEAGESAKVCSCGAKTSVKVIPYVSSVKLSAAAYTYNGKVKTPSVTVKDTSGKTLTKNTDYKVSYASGRKNVGKYAVTITLTGNYSGSKTLYFEIRPAATKITSLKKGSKSFTVKYKKQTTQTTGYQIQYSTSKNFSSAKTVTVGKNKTVSKKITKLSKKKTYYVRVRTYKAVKFNKKTMYIYSAWSSAKSVKTK